MVNDREKILMKKFLQTNFPIKRIKVKSRFRRAMILGNQIYVLGDKNNHTTFITEMIKILSIVFDNDILTNREILDDFLHLK